MNYLAARKRATKYTCRNIVEAAQILSPERKAELIVERIMELMDQRADILGISRLSPSTKEQISKAMNGSELLTKNEFDEQMRAEILQTREKVLMTIAECKADFAKAEKRAEMEGMGFWRSLGCFVTVAFIFYCLAKTSTGLFSFMSVVIEGYFTVRYGCKTDREHLLSGDVERHCWRVGRFCAGHGMSGDFGA